MKIGAKEKARRLPVVKRLPRSEVEVSQGQIHFQGPGRGAINSERGRATNCTGTYRHIAGM